WPGRRPTLSSATQSAKPKTRSRANELSHGPPALAPLFCTASGRTKGSCGPRSGDPYSLHLHAPFDAGHHGDAASRRWCGYPKGARITWPPSRHDNSDLRQATSANLRRRLASSPDLTRIHPPVIGQIARLHSQEWTSIIFLSNAVWA